MGNKASSHSRPHWVSSEPIIDSYWGRPTGWNQTWWNERLASVPTTEIPIWLLR